MSADTADATLGLWGIIAAATIADALFALAYRESFEHWELNPFARMMGVEGAVAYRLLSVAGGYFAVGLLDPGPRFRVTLFLALVHLLLLCWLLAAIL